MQCVAVVEVAGYSTDVYSKQFCPSETVRCVRDENVEVGTVNADPMVKKLFCSVRVTRDVSALKPLGIVPDKKLVSKYMISMRSKAALISGIGPVNEFVNKLNTTKDVIPISVAGIDPDMELVSKYRTVIDLKDPILGGMVPVNLFRDAIRTVKAGSWLILEGIEPVRRLSPKSRYFKFLSRPTVEGIVLRRRPLPITKCVKLRKSPISEGSVPDNTNPEKTIDSTFA